MIFKYIRAGRGNNSEHEMYLPTVFLRLSASADHFARAEYECRCPRLPDQSLYNLFTFEKSIFISTRWWIVINPPNPHDDGSKSLWVVLSIPCMQGDLLQVQLHPHVDSAASNVEFLSKVLEIWRQTWQCSGAVGQFRTTWLTGGSLVKVEQVKQLARRPAWWQLTIETNDQWGQS